MSVGRSLQSHPRALERAYRLAERSLQRLAPLSSRIAGSRARRWIRTAEAIAKRWVFDCRMCGQCVLHDTGMTCPMTCPKQLRNGPCGGVRADGSCEVDPEIPCVWAVAVARSAGMSRPGAGIARIQPPVDHRLEGSSAWLNRLAGADRCAPPGWERIAGSRR